MLERTIGYAYDAAASGSLEQQIERLKAAGCAEIITDSSKTDNLFRRPGFRAAIRTLHAGDTLVVCTVQRLSRTHSELLRAIEHLMSEGVELAALDDPDHAMALKQQVNYAPQPTLSGSPIRYAASRLGALLVRYSKRISHTS